MVRQKALVNRTAPREPDLGKNIQTLDASLRLESSAVSAIRTGASAGSVANRSRDCVARGLAKADGLRLGVGARPFDVVVPVARAEPDQCRIGPGLVQRRRRSIPLKPIEPEQLASIVSVGPRDCPSPHGLGNKLGRTAWGAVWLLLFRPSPRILYFWRRTLLRLFGARIGRGCKVSPSTRIWAPWNLTMEDYSSLGYDVDCYCVAAVWLGAHSTVSQYSFLCTASHDVSDPHMRLTSAPIRIGDQAWICADVFVSPGITIGQGAVAGAGAVVVHDVAPWTVVGGNPAVEINKRRFTAGIDPHSGN